jgi:ankyrin repeat protein
MTQYLLFFVTFLAYSCNLAAWATETPDSRESFCKEWLARFSCGAPPLVENPQKVTYAAGVGFINIFHQQPYILLGCRSQSSEWNIPGGLFEESVDCDLEDSAIRETNEELFIADLDAKIEKSVLKGATSVSVISPHPTESDQLMQFSMFVTTFPPEKLPLINKTLFKHRHKGCEINEFQWFLLTDLLEQMSFLKLGSITQVNYNYVNITSLEGRRRIDLYPELILMLYSLWPNFNASNIPLHFPTNANILNLPFSDWHRYFIRSVLVDSIARDASVLKKKPREKNDARVKVLSSVVWNHQQAMRLIKTRFPNPPPLLHNDNNARKVSPYSQTEGFLKIILSGAYVENDLEGNMRRFFSEHHDPAYRVRFNCPEFSFSGFDPEFQQKVFDIVKAEASTDDFVFYHGLSPETALFHDFLTELYSQLSMESRSTLLRPLSNFLTRFPNISAFLKYFDQEKELLPHLCYNYLPGYQRWGLSSNISFLGNYGNFGSSTFDYFWKGHSESPPPFHQTFFKLCVELGVPLYEIESLSLELSGCFVRTNLISDEEINEQIKGNFGHSKNGRLLQIFVPRDCVNEFAYPSVVRGQPIDFRYPPKGECLHSGNIDGCVKTRDISPLLNLLRENPDGLEEILKLNRTVPEMSGQEQPFREQETSPYRSGFFNTPDAVKYISLIEARNFLGMQDFETQVKTKTYERFPIEPKKQQQRQGEVKNLVRSVLVAAFDSQTSQTSFSFHRLSGLLTTKSSLTEHFSLVPFIRGDQFRTPCFSIAQKEREQLLLCVSIAEGDWEAVQHYFTKNSLEEIDNPILSYTLDKKDETIRVHSLDDGTTASTIRATTLFSTPLKFAFAQEDRMDRIIFELLTLNPKLVNSLIRKYRNSIYLYTPWINNPNSLLIRLAHYFFKNKKPLSALRNALGEPPKDCWNNLESCIFSSYGTPVRKQLCDYALSEGISLSRLSMTLRFSPLHSPSDPESDFLKTVDFVLLQGGENPDVLGAYNRVAFAAASLYGYPRVLANLSSSGHGSSLRDEFGISALGYCAASGRHEVIDFFAKLSLDGISLERKIELMFHSCLMCGTMNILLYLEEKFQIQSNYSTLMTTLNESGRTAYKNLVRGYSSEIVKHLMKYMDLLAYRDKDGNSLLHLSVLSQPVKTIYRKKEKDKFYFTKFLLSIGFNSLEKNKTKKTALWLFSQTSIWKERSDLYFDYLHAFYGFLSQKKGSEHLCEAVNPKNDLPEQSLQEITTALVNNKFQTTTRLELWRKLDSGIPLLNQMIQNEFAQRMNALIAMNAVFTRLGLFTSSPTMVRFIKALKKQKLKALPPARLQKRIPSVYDFTRVAVLQAEENDRKSISNQFDSVYGRSMFIKALLRHDCALELRDKDGLTALSVACGFGMILYVKCLLDANANPLATDNCENNSLFYAIYSNSPDIVELLINDVLAKNPQKYLELVNQENSQGRTPFMEACRIKRLICLNKLLDSEKLFNPLTSSLSLAQTIAPTSAKAVENSSEEAALIPTVLNIYAKDKK